MKILKFGESTLVDGQSIGNIIDIIIKQSSKKNEIAVVVSAMKDIRTTLGKISQLAMVGDASYRPMLQNIEDRHFAIVKQYVDVKHQAKVLANLKVILNDLEDILHGVYLLWELSPRTMDHIRTYGVRLMAYLMSECIKAKGLDAIYADTQQMIVTDNNYGNAAIDFESTEKKVKDWFKKNKGIQVFTGYIGATAKGESTTMGRAGASLTASVIGAVVEAEDIEIYTDRDGITNTDKDLVKNAYSLESLTYAEAMELSNFGTRVIYPLSLQPAFKENIPVIVKNLFNPSFKGTIIKKKAEANPKPIKASSSIKEISLLNIQGSGMVGIAGVAGRVFSRLAGNDINVILITQASSEHSITLAIAPQDGDKAIDILKKEFAEEIKKQKIDKIALKEKMSILAVIGDNMQHTPGIAGKVFSALGNQGINIAAIAQGSSELNISIVLESKNLSKALNILQENFF